MRLGIFSNVIQGATIEEWARKHREAGFESVMLWPTGFTGVKQGGYHTMYGELMSKEEAERIKNAFDAEGIRVVALASYTNYMHFDPDRRRANIERLKRTFEMAHWVGAHIVATETGTLSKDGDWSPHSKNYTEATWNEFLAVNEELVESAQREGIVLALEPFTVNIVSDVERALRIVRHFNSPHLKLVLDPVNWLHPGNLGAMDDLLKMGIPLLLEHCVMAHAKDVRPGKNPFSLDHPGPGRGWLNYGLYLRLLVEHHFQGDLILEHLQEEDVEFALDHIRRHWPQT